MSLLDSLVSYWKLDESSGVRLDSAGPNDLSDNNTVGSAAGKISNAADFERGNSEYLAISDASQSGLDLSGAFSVSFWLKAETIGVFQNIFGKMTGTQSSGGWAYGLWLNDNNTLNFHVSQSTSVKRDTYTTSAVITSTAVWYHVVCVFNPSTSVSIYVNGVSQATNNNNSTVPSGVQNTGAPFSIGSIKWAAPSPYVSYGDFFDGLIDEFGIWSRVLTSDEVSSLYNGGLGFAYPFSVVTFSVSTAAVSDIGTTTAVFNGSIVDVGSGDVDLRGFVFDVVSHGDPGDIAPAASSYGFYSSEAGSFSVGAFDFSASGLSDNETYYVRSWAHGADGYVYGSEVSFSTDAIVYAVSGTVTLSGAPVSGAVVRCIRQSDNVAIAAEVTDSLGQYIFSGLDVSDFYHLSVEYEDAEKKYYTFSYWDIVPFATN